MYKPLNVKGYGDSFWTGTIRGKSEEVTAVYTLVTLVGESGYKLQVRREVDLTTGCIAAETTSPNSYSIGRLTVPALQAVRQARGLRPLTAEAIAQLGRGEADLSTASGRRR